jgi:outer membrane immunogenic protein
MLRQATVIAASVVALAASAHAADIYSAPGAGGYKDAYVPAAPLWSGFYLGVNGGYGWSAKKSSAGAYADEDPANIAVIPDETIGYFNRNGGFGGGQIGYNIQRDHLLIGLEADLQGSALQGKRSVTAISDGVEIPVPGEAITTAKAKSELDYFGTVRGRVGFAADRALFYFTGGFAYGGAKDSLTTTITNTPEGATPYSNTVTKKGTRTGYTLGGGVEYAVTPAWSLKAEYQYLDLGKVRLEDGDTLNNGTAGETASETNHTYHTVRLGLNYRLQQDYVPLK